MSSSSLIHTVPPPQRVYLELKRQLLSASRKSGERLPPLRELARRFDVSVGAVRTAVNRLEHDRLVILRHGSGIYVADAQVRTRQVLLLNRAEGHVWAQLSQTLIDRFSAQPHFRLLVETIPHGEPERLPAFRQKLAALFDGGIDTVLFNGITGSGVDQILDDLPEHVSRLCFFSRSAIRHRPAVAGVGGVVSDWYHGGHVAMRHLVEAGCRDIAVTLPHPEAGGELREFFRGCKDAAEDSAVPVRTRRLICSGESHDARQQAAQWLAQQPTVDGVVAYADFVALPIITALQQLGRRVPDDVAVVGYYDTPWTTAIHPTLSSVSTRCDAIADAAADMLLAGRFFDVEVVHPRLVVRQSSRRHGAST